MNSLWQINEIFAVNTFVFFFGFVLSIAHLGREKHIFMTKVSSHLVIAVVSTDLHRKTLKLLQMIIYHSIHSIM